MPNIGLPLTDAAGGASLYSATSYSKRPGVSSTTPDTRAPCGLLIRNITFGSKDCSGAIYYKLPANPAALFCMTVGSGGLHIIINS